MLSILKRFYPERERRAGREGRVVLAVLIGADGIAEPEDVVVSAGRDFDAAAAEVVRLMRFEPASGPQGPFVVRLKQAVDFRLQD
jgi:TonB family protein